MAPKLYKLDASPPVRAVMMALDIFGVEAEYIDVDIPGRREHLKPEFLKKNPLHSIPVYEDGDFILHDSHAILQYLADTYGKDDSWYPKDVKKRALVNQKLFFDTGYLFPRLRNITFPTIVGGEKIVPKSKLDDIVEVYGFLEEFLSRSKYIAGDQITIADLSAIADVTSLVYLVPLDAAKYPKVVAWAKDIESKPFCKKCNEPGARLIGELIKNGIDLSCAQRDG